MTKKALLVVCFGTSYTQTGVRAITATENALSSAFPDRDIHRAYTSNGVRKILFARDGQLVDSVDEAMEKLVDQGYVDVLAQPLHIIPGIEYEMMLTGLAAHANMFDTIRVGKPLLASHQDLKEVVGVMSRCLAEVNSHETLLLMGHGTRHSANRLYGQLETTFRENGFRNVFIATVEGTPTLAEIIPRLKANGCRHVTLMPLMLVAGDHAQNDMAGENDDSWKSVLTREGIFVQVFMTGLGELKGIRQCFINHAMQATPLDDILKGTHS